MASYQLESDGSLTAPLPVIEEGNLSTKQLDFQNFVEILAGLCSTDMIDYILSFATGSNGEPHLLPGAIAIKIISSIIQRGTI